MHISTFAVVISAPVESFFLWSCKHACPLEAKSLKTVSSSSSVGQNVQLRRLEENVQLHLHRVCGSLHCHAPRHPPLLVCLMFYCFFSISIVIPKLHLCVSLGAGLNVHLFSRIIHTTLVYPLTLYQPFFGFYFFNGLMCLLQVLQIFWAGLILRMVVKFLPGNVKKEILYPLNLYFENSPRANELFFFFLFRGRTSSKMSAVTKRRPSQTTKAKTCGKNPKMATCGTATPPLTTTTRKGTDWTLMGCVVPPTGRGHQPESQIGRRVQRATRRYPHAPGNPLLCGGTTPPKPHLSSLHLPHSSCTTLHFRPAILVLQAALLIPGVLKST